MIFEYVRQVNPFCQSNESDCPDGTLGIEAAIYGLNEHHVVSYKTDVK